jgi:uncharacterized protein YbjT (DUF2867 family)
MPQPIIAVFGASGAQGGGLVRSILNDPARRFRVRALTRHPHGKAAYRLRAAGAEVAYADLDRPASLRPALRGAYGAFCVTNYWEHASPERELQQARNAAAAAAAARLRHVVWSTLEDTRALFEPGSRMPALLGRYNVPHFDAKGEANAAFFGAGVPTTLLSTSFHWENLIQSGMQPRRGPGGELVFILPMGSARLPGVAAADIGVCVLEIFARGPELIGKAIGIAAEHLTGAEMAAELATALGEPVMHLDMAPDAYARLELRGAAELANMFAFMRAFEHLHCAARPPACARELHPGMLTFAGWLARHAAGLAPAEPPAARPARGDDQ